MRRGHPAVIEGENKLNGLQYSCAVLRSSLAASVREKSLVRACCRGRLDYMPLHTPRAMPWKGGIGARGAACGRLPGISRENISCIFVELISKVQLITV